MTEKQYGPKARTDESFDDLTTKQQRTIQAIESAADHATEADIASEAGVSNSYVSYVREHFPHIIDNRVSTMALEPDGGQPLMAVELTADKWHKAVRQLPEELSQEIFEQIRK